MIYEPLYGRAKKESRAPTGVGREAQGILALSERVGGTSIPETREYHRTAKLKEE